MQTAGMNSQVVANSHVAATGRGTDTVALRGGESEPPYVGCYEITMANVRRFVCAQKILFPPDGLKTIVFR